MEIFSHLVGYYGLLTTFAILILWFVIVVPFGRRTSGKNLPPTLPWLPIIGSAPFMSGVDEYPSRYFQKLQKKIGNIYAFYSGSRFTVVLNTTKDMHEAFVRKGLIFADRGPNFGENHVVNVKQKGLGFRPYDDGFKRNRQVAIAIFKELGYGSNVMEQRILLEVCEILTKLRATNGRPFGPDVILSLCMLNIVSNMILGARFDDDHVDDLKKLDRSIRGWADCQVRELEDYPILRYLPRYKRKMCELEQHNQGLLKVVDECIEATIAGKRDVNFASLYIESEGSSVDREDLRFLMRDMIIGSNAVDLQIQWALILFANHPEIQTRVQEEIDSVIPRGRLPSMQDRAKLPYVEATILEVMRIRIVAPHGVSHVTNGDSEVGGYHIPSNSIIIPCIYSPANDPDVWTNPEKFNPDRFINTSGNIVGSEKNIPFGLGKRACPGEAMARQALFLIITALLQHFEIRPPEGKSQVEYRDVEIFDWFAVDYKLRLIDRKLDSSSTK